MGILGLVLPWWAKYAAIALILTGVAAFGWFKGNEHGTEKLNSYVSKQAAELTRIAAVRTAITERIITQYITKTVPQTQVVTNTIEKEVIRYENAKLDTCNLSAGAVVLHDSAVANTVPDSARSVDGTASQLETSAIVKTCTENYAIFHQTADRLRALQSWVTEQAAAK